MKSLIETLEEVRDGISSFDKEYHARATVSSLRGAVRGVQEVAADVAGSADEVSEQRRELHDLAESLLETATVMELTERQAKQDHREEVKEAALERLEELLCALNESVQKEITSREIDEDDDLDGEDDVDDDIDEENEDDESDDLDEGGEHSSDLTLDTFLDGLVYDIQKEGIEDPRDAIGILSSVVHQMVEDGELPEIPEMDAGHDESTDWTILALQSDLPGLVTQLARSVENE